MISDQPRGPKFKCRNGNCDLIKPQTTVHESERKTLYRCPGCSRTLHVDWRDDDDDDGDDNNSADPDHKPAERVQPEDIGLGVELEI